MALANLNFVNEKRPTPTYRATSEERRRQAVLEAIQVQKHLLAVDLGQQVAPLTRTIRVADEHGVLQEKTVERKPVRWFWRTANGYAVEMQYARIPVPVGGTGKTTIGVKSLEDVGKVLDVLAEATSKGELDKALAQASEAAKKRKSKNAA